MIGPLGHLGRYLACLNFEMHATVATLYDVFKPYRLGDDLAGCEHCVPPEDSAMLSSKPMREMSASDLNRFAFKSMSTWGTDRHFKHFLPRLLELLLDNYAAFDFPESLIRKLEYAKCDNWPDNERNAVIDFFEYLWSYHLAIPTEFEGDDRVATLLDAISSTTKTMHPYLDMFVSQDSVVAAHHLREIITNFGDDIMTDNRRDFNLTRSDEFVDWLASDGVINYLKRYESEMVAATPWLFDQLDGIRGEGSTGASS